MTLDELIELLDAGTPDSEELLIGLAVAFARDRQWISAAAAQRAAASLGSGDTLAAAAALLPGDFAAQPYPAGRAHGAEVTRGRTGHTQIHLTAPLALATAILKLRRRTSRDAPGQAAGRAPAAAWLRR